ncbi:MAG: hypothetical protein ACQSGP_08865, partial [Frankia sp.]
RPAAAWVVVAATALPAAGSSVAGSSSSPSTGPGTLLPAVGAVSMSVPVTTKPTAVTLTPEPAAAPAASRKAGVDTQEAIVAAVHGSALTSDVPASYYRVLDVRVSRANPNFASAQLVPTNDQIAPGMAVLRHDAAGWTLIDVGSGEVGCGVVPVPARAELNVTCVG